MGRWLSTLACDAAIFLFLKIQYRCICARREKGMVYPRTAERAFDSISSQVYSVLLSAFVIVWVARPEALPPLGVMIFLWVIVDLLVAACLSLAPDRPFDAVEYSDAVPMETLSMTKGYTV